MLRAVYVIAALAMTVNVQAGLASTVDTDDPTEDLLQLIQTFGGGGWSDGRMLGSTPNVLPQFFDSTQPADNPTIGFSDDGDGEGDLVLPTTPPPDPIIQLVTEGRDGNTIPTQPDPFVLLFQPTPGGADSDEAQLSALAVVPVPAAGLLMLAGLGMLFGLGRRRQV